MSNNINFGDVEFGVPESDSPCCAVVSFMIGRGRGMFGMKLTELWQVAIQEMKYIRWISPVVMASNSQSQRKTSKASKVAALSM